MRSPSGGVSGYSGRSSGKMVSSICSTAYLYPCPYRYSFMLFSEPAGEAGGILKVKSEKWKVKI